MGELIEEVEYDDWSAPLEAADSTLPAWCRAAALLEGEYEELQARECVCGRVVGALPSVLPALMLIHDGACVPCGLRAVRLGASVPEEVVSGQPRWQG